MRLNFFHILFWISGLNALLFEILISSRPPHSVCELLNLSQVPFFANAPCSVFSFLGCTMLLFPIDSIGTEIFHFGQVFRELKCKTRVPYKAGGGGGGGERAKLKWLSPKRNKLTQLPKAERKVHANADALLSPYGEYLRATWQNAWSNSNILILEYTLCLLPELYMLFQLQHFFYSTSSVGLQWSRNVRARFSVWHLSGLWQRNASATNTWPFPLHFFGCLCAAIDAVVVPCTAIVIFRLKSDYFK